MSTHSWPGGSQQHARLSGAVARLLCENVLAVAALGVGVPAAFEPMLALPCDAAGRRGVCQVSSGSRLHELGLKD